MFKLLNTATATTESFMVQNGKIYLVMTIVSIILIGLFIYVASVDKKLTQLEKK
jgi:CcmD family protein